MALNVDNVPYTEEMNMYIMQVFSPVVEEMLGELLTEMPASPLDYMIDWLRKRNGSCSTLGRKSLVARNSQLQQELTTMKRFMQEAGASIRHEATEYQVGDVGEDYMSDEDDDVDDLPEDYKQSESESERARKSVSAEAYGEWNKKKEYQPPSFAKSDEQKARLSGVLKKSFLFSGLETKDLETILMAFIEKRFEMGTKVIREGEDGDYLFVIEEGSLDCHKKVNGADVLVKTVHVGDVFGELALLYNCPRAASVVAKLDCVCWQLGRKTFNHIVKDSAMKRREKYDSFLKSVSLLSGVDAYERSQLADALKPETYKKGDVVVVQDDPGDKFYIVEDGALYAEKEFIGEGKKKTMEYMVGDYFGELALLKNQPRAASVIVASNSAKLLALPRQSFQKMLGPLQNILARNVANYR